MMQLTQEVIERDFCPRCIHYIDKQYIYRDCEKDISNRKYKDWLSFHRS